MTYTPDWEDEARRYYANIVGKYGVQVQGLLKKAAALEIASVCPLHGPQLSGDALAHALELYGHWAAWKPEEKGVLVAFASFHGHTAEAAGYMAKCLEELGEKVELIDLNRVHKSYAVSVAFRFDRMVLCANTYDGAYAPAMEAFLSILKIKGLQGRTVALMENGTWAPMAAKHMRAAMEGMKNMTILDTQVTIRSAMSEKNRTEIEQMAKEIHA
ncbi:MAG: flavodoxin domain-containing protein [Christensenellales bacterium]